MPNQNITLSKKIITQLVKIHGVKTFCLCPGGRNAPLVSVLSHTKGVEVLSFFEERSAGFFALGRVKRDHIPCAIITTSGTAVAELLPCVIEAYYSHIPLVIITADRPSTYRKTGAPQSIQQMGIFSHYVKQQWDLEHHLDFDLSLWNQKISCHINICFDEPLIDKDISDLVFVADDFKSSQIFDFNQLLKKHHSQIKSFFKQVQLPLCILAEIPQSRQKNIEDCLFHLPWPIYAEAISGLRESNKLNSLILKSGENFLKYLAKNKKIDGILRIGRRPCTRFWIDLEQTYPNLPILSVSDQNYSGLARSTPAVSFESFLKWSEGVKKSKEVDISKSLKTDGLKLNNIFKKDKIQTKVLHQLIHQYPNREPALINQLSQKIPDHSLVFLGNSLPIREWNNTATYQNKHFKYISNRGANGIDGLISTFLGVCELDKQNWCVIGDLSCLYDLSAPWILRKLDKNLSCFFVVINNQGGQIFSSLFQESLFLNSHNLQFKSWAHMWSMNYYCITKWPKVLNFTSPAVIELQINKVFV